MHIPKSSGFFQSLVEERGERGERARGLKGRRLPSSNVFVCLSTRPELLLLICCLSPFPLSFRQPFSSFIFSHFFFSFLFFCRRLRNVTTARSLLLAILHLYARAAPAPPAAGAAVALHVLSLLSVATRVRRRVSLCVCVPLCRWLKERAPRPRDARRSGCLFSSLFAVLLSLFLSPLLPCAADLVRAFLSCCTCGNL